MCLPKNLQAMKGWDIIMNQNFWKDKRVLVTGHTGFKGSWLSIWLHEMGATVIGYALDPHTDEDNFVLSGIGNRMIDIRADIRDMERLKKTFEEYKPEVVFHLAAQPLVRYSYEHPKETYEINVMGTMNVLECIKESEYARIGILITTDKCYDNKEDTRGYNETDPLGGYDPYSSSKACAEILISSYRNSYFHPENYEVHKKAIASVRAGNVIGGGDWARDRIVPDCIRALQAGKPIEIRSPGSVRPWQLVLEPLAGYLQLAEKLYQEPTKYSGGWNFGPEYHSADTVWNIAGKIVREYGEGSLIDCSGGSGPHEAKLLYLDITKAKTLLKWKPRLDLEQTIAMTVAWYREYRQQNVYDLCKNQIREFSKNE